MAEKLLFEKELEYVRPTQNFDRLDCTDKGLFSKWNEKHYLPKGTVPEGAKVVCRYYLIEE